MKRQRSVSVKKEWRSSRRNYKCVKWLLITCSVFENNAFADRLYFLKTHKTASSVVENILYRYGLRTDKTFAFPKNGGLVYNYRKPFTKGMMLPDIPRPDILQQHTRYSTGAAQLFPKSDSYRITIFRFRSRFLTASI